MSYRPGYRRFPRAVRNAVLRRDPICVACRVHPATVVDHVTPDYLGGQATLDNGQSLCRGCHDVKTAAERLHATRQHNQQRPKRQRPTERHPGLT